MSHNSHYSAYHTTKLQHSLSYNTLILIYSRAQEHYFPRPTITLTLSLLPKTHTYYLTSTNSLFVCLSGKKKNRNKNLIHWTAAWFTLRTQSLSMDIFFSLLNITTPIPLNLPSFLIISFLPLNLPFSLFRFFICSALMES